MSAIITLTTDFGAAGPYVAAIKGVILGINPAARLIDISHDVGPQDVRRGAAILAEATPWFPASTVHVGVIDPGVGTSRRLVYARIGDQQYLAPDNGLLSLLARRNRPSRIVELKNAEHWLPAISQTFHGRDILAPVAAQISMGLEPEQLGPPMSELQTVDWPEPFAAGNQLDGIVQWIDGFGNLISNIPGAMLNAGPADRLQIGCAGREVIGIAKAYGERGADELTALVGSSGFLEIAVVNGNAVLALNATVGAPITVHW